MKEHCWTIMVCVQYCYSYVPSSENLLIKCMTSSAYQLKLIFICNVMAETQWHVTIICVYGSQVCAVITFAVWT